MSTNKEQPQMSEELYFKINKKIQTVFRGTMAGILATSLTITEPPKLFAQTPQDTASHSQENDQSIPPYITQIFEETDVDSTADEVKTADWDDRVSFDTLPTLNSIEEVSPVQSIYHFEYLTLPQHEGESITYEVEVTKHLSTDYIYFQKYYGMENYNTGKTIYSLRFTTDGKRLNSSDTSQFGLMVYFAEDTIPNGKTLATLVTEHAKQLFPEVVEALMNCGFKLRHQYINNNDENEYYRFATWLVSTKSMGGFAHIPDYSAIRVLPSEAGWIGPSYDVINSPDMDFLIDALCHELTHASVSFLGSQATQEAMAQLLGINFTTLMAEKGLVDSDLYKDAFDRRWTKLTTNTGRSAELADAGEWISSTEYDANYFLYLLYKNFDNLGIDPSTSFDEDGYILPAALQTAIDTLLKAAYEPRKFLTDEEFDNKITQLYGAPNNKSFEYSPVASGDLGFSFIMNIAETMRQGNSDWEKAFAETLKISKYPLDREIISYLEDIFEPSSKPVVGPVSSQITSELFLNEESVQATGNAYINSELIHIDDVLSFNLNKRSELVGNEKFPNAGYPMNTKLFNLRSQSISDTTHSFVLHSTADTKNLNIAIRTASGDYYQKLSTGWEELSLPASTETYYILVSQATDFGDQEQTIEPFSVSQTGVQTRLPTIIKAEQ